MITSSEELIDYMNDVTENNALAACDGLADGAFLAELQQEGVLPEDSEDPDEEDLLVSIVDEAYVWFRDIVETRSCIVYYSAREGINKYLVLKDTPITESKLIIKNLDEVLSLLEEIEEHQAEEHGDSSSTEDYGLEEYSWEKIDNLIKTVKDAPRHFYADSENFVYNRDSKSIPYIWD